jgi:hypothetical protein
VDLREKTILWEHEFVDYTLQGNNDMEITRPTTKSTKINTPRKFLNPQYDHINQDDFQVQLRVKQGPGSGEVKNITLSYKNSPLTHTVVAKR